VPSRVTSSPPEGASSEAGRTAWLDRLGSLRNVSRQLLVTRQLASHLPAVPARVLDVGAGQGTQALELARLGYDVVAAEPDPAMRERLSTAQALAPAAESARIRIIDARLGSLVDELRPASYDVVLCHGVLMYLTESGRALRELTELVASGGLLSLVFRNADGIALRPALRRDWAEVNALLDAAAEPNPSYLNEIGVPARADRLVEVEAVLSACGLSTEAWYGVRIATDGVDADELPPDDPVELEALLQVEERLGRTDPYRQVATLLHLLSRRPG
jgi:S-adenosylmethionine-dependent methyltransferase